MTGLDAYSHALLSVALVALMAMVLTAMTGGMKGKAGLTPGAAPPVDYNSILYRVSRAQANTLEALAMFAAVVMVCVLSGAAPFWVNLLASLVFLFRLAMAVVHVRGIGKADGGPRSMLFAGAFFCMIGLGLIGAVAALQ